MLTTLWIMGTILIGSILGLVYMQMMISFILDKQGFPAMQHYQVSRFYIWCAVILNHIDPRWTRKEHASDLYLRTHLVLIVIGLISVLLAPIGMIELCARKFHTPSLVAI